MRRIGLLVADRLVQRVFREVDAECGRQLAKHAFDAGVAFVVLVAGAGERFGLVDDDGGAGEELQATGIAAKLSGALAHVGHLRSDKFELRAVDEDALGMAGGEMTAAGRTTRLEQHRRPLR